METLLIKAINGAIHVQMDLAELFFQQFMPTINALCYAAFGFVANKFGGHK